MVEIENVIDISVRSLRAKKKLKECEDLFTKAMNDGDIDKAYDYMSKAKTTKDELERLERLLNDSKISA